MFKNTYFYRARLLPAVLTSIPMLIFLNKIIAVKYHDALKNMYEVLPIIADLGLSAALIFLWTQINRLTAKEIFQRLYFKDELSMPTTEHLLLKNDYYTDDIKNKIRGKIISKYSLNLLGEQDEQQNELNARKQIVTGVSQIRIDLKGNEMLFRHNIEYGFFRNMLGGCVWAVIFSAAIFIYGFHFNNNDLKLVGVVSFIIYLLPICLSKFLINRFGKYYAKILYEQFLNI